jgi:uncharacterized damage-inducible protein DinB
MKTETELLQQFFDKFKEGFDRVFKAVSQLDSDQIWIRPSSESNSVGILLQHLSGNLNQWVYAGIGGAEFHRNRPEEFLDHQKITKDEILKKVQDLGKSVEEVISRIPPDSLHSPRRIQGLDVTVLAALFKALTHFEFHEGQILYIAKLLLNEKYEGIWGPKKQP